MLRFRRSSKADLDIEVGGPSRPVVVTCSEKQILTTLEAPGSDCTETLISIHLLLSAEQKARLSLTLSQLNEELFPNTNLTKALGPLPHFTRKDETKLDQVQKIKSIAPVPRAIDVDGVDLRFDSIVVLQGHLPQGLYLSRQDLRCYNIGVQDAQGETQIDERASLVVSFGTTEADTTFRHDRHRFRSLHFFTECIEKDCIHA